MVDVNSPEEFDKWVTSSEPGERVVYAETNFCYGNPCKHAAWNAAVAGKVALFQERRGMMLYRYIAVRISPRAAVVLAPFKGAQF